MTPQPLVSILVPVYKGEAFLGQLIDSLLAQTYPHFELILVDDVSPDSSAAVIQQYKDSRIRYIRHARNMGSDAARLTALDASRGELVATLDQDDLFHPRKLELHAALHAAQPSLGLTFNQRFEMNYHSETVRDVWAPPNPLSLADLIIGYPLAPSDVVMKREWILRRDIWADDFVLHGDEVITNGGEIVFFGRLLLAGCQFAGIDQPLNYRRHHPGRILSDLPKRCSAELECQRMVLDDPRCPDETRAIRERAQAETYAVWSAYALDQQETELAQAYLRHAVRLRPSLLEGRPCPLVKSLASYVAANEGREVVQDLRDWFGRFPPDLAWLSSQANDAARFALSRRAVNVAIWGGEEQHRHAWAQVRRQGCILDSDLVGVITHQLGVCEQIRGPGAARMALAQISSSLAGAGCEGVAQLKGRFHMNRAFRQFQSGAYKGVPASVLRAMVNDRRYASNRGALSILFRSLLPRTRNAW